LFGITITFVLEIVLEASVKPFVTTVVTYKCAVSFNGHVRTIDNGSEIQESLANAKESA